MLTVNPKVKAFEVGQPLLWHDMANRRRGVVTAVAPDNHYANSFRYTCVFDDEYETVASHFLVVGWVTAGPLLTSAQIAKFVAAHEVVKKKYEADKAREAEESKARIAALPSLNPHLSPASAYPNWGKPRLAAHNLRIVLKRTYPTTRFSVRTDINAVDVVWRNGPSEQDVLALASQFKDSYFDGQTDSTHFVEGAARDFTRVFGGVTYIGAQRAEAST